MKIRLYRGPFSGQVMEERYGRETLMIIAPKKMSRKQQMQWQMSPEYEKALRYSYVGQTTDGGKAWMAPVPRPMIRAEYRRKTVSTLLNGNMFSNIPCIHPDGSMFYEWTGYSVPVL